MSNIRKKKVLDDNKRGKNLIIKACWKEVGSYLWHRSTCLCLTNCSGFDKERVLSACAC